jgi:hypothetical protein
VRGEIRSQVRNPGYVPGFFTSNMPQRGSMRRTSIELERADSSYPVKTSRDCVVLLRIPKRAVVARVNRHRTVIAPAMKRIELHAASVDKYKRAVHCTPWIVCSSAAHVDAGKDALAGRAETQRRIANMVHGNAAEPIIHVWIFERSLLVNRWRRGITDLVPAHGSKWSTSNCVIDDQGFMIAEVAIGQAEHHSIR